MHRILNRILAATAGAIVLLDATWLVAGHFQIDSGRYGLLFLLVLPLIAASFYYGEFRREDAISATLAASGFLLVFSAGCSLLSYLLLTIAGPRIDAQLALVDRAMGFSWPHLMALVAAHPSTNLVLRWAYTSVMPQSAGLLLLLGWKGKCAELYAFCLAIAAGAAISLAVWTMYPSFGAFSVFTLPPDVASRLGLVLGFDYGRQLVGMLAHGPGFISPSELRGLVGFPSFHTVQALVLIWYARSLRGVRWAALILNAVVLVSIPVQGGHHLVDMIGGAAVTIVAIWMAEAAVAWASRQLARDQQRAPDHREPVRAA
jgi:PAP2 superfamily protein